MNTLKKQIKNKSKSKKRKREYVDNVAINDDVTIYLTWYDKVMWHTYVTSDDMFIR